MINKTDDLLINKKEEKIMIKKKKKGFTLIELIVVIAILGILAAVAIPRFSGMTDNAKKTACATEAKTVVSALQSMYATDSSSVSTSTVATDPNLVKLTGPLNGALVITTLSTSGGITGTYTIGSHTTTITDSVIGVTN